MESVDKYTITLPPAGSGAQTWHLRCRSDFFALLDHPDLRDGDVDVEVSLTPSGSDWRSSIRCHGFVVTDCDRCLEPLRIDVDETYEATIIPDTERDPAFGDCEDTLYYDPATGHLPLLRPIGDTLALALPLRKTHPEGECDPAMEEAINGRQASPALDSDALRALRDALGHDGPSGIN